MGDRTPITDVSSVPDDGSYRFVVEDLFTNEREAILVRCTDEPGIRGWINSCPHEDQRFDAGSGAPMRDGEIVCPRHGSMFDACSGDCGNGPAAGTTLPAVDIAVEGEEVLLADDSYTYVRDGGSEDDDGPSSTSHLSL